MSLFDRFRRRRDMAEEATGRSKPSAETREELEEFLRTRPDVEAYVEPPTNVYAMSLCLVAADGEYRRRPVKDEKQARELCDAYGVPMYDAGIVGYPGRMRDFQRGVRREQVSLDDLPPLETTEDPGREGRRSEPGGEQSPE